MEDNKKQRTIEQAEGTERMNISEEQWLAATIKFNLHVDEAQPWSWRRNDDTYVVYLDSVGDWIRQVAVRAGPAM